MPLVEMFWVIEVTQNNMDHAWTLFDTTLLKGSTNYFETWCRIHAILAPKLNRHIYRSGQNALRRGKVNEKCSLSNAIYSLGSKTPWFAINDWIFFNSEDHSIIWFDMEKTLLYVRKSIFRNFISLLIFLWTINIE